MNFYNYEQLKYKRNNVLRNLESKNIVECILLRISCERITCLMYVGSKNNINPLYNYTKILSIN